MIKNNRKKLGLHLSIKDEEIQRISLSLSRQIRNIQRQAEKKGIRLTFPAASHILAQNNLKNNIPIKFKKRKKGELGLRF